MTKYHNGEIETYLIHHHYLSPIHFCNTLSHKVEYPAWCGNHYVH